LKYWIIVFFALALFSFILTWFVRLWAQKFQILDIPNKRSSHNIPTPRGGGVAIVICWYIGITLLFLHDNIADNLYYAFLSGLILAVVSFIDDILSLKPAIRLVGQLISASLALFFLAGIDLNWISDWKSVSEIFLIPLLIISIIWFINLYNFLDGIDGYASIEAICIAATIFIFTGNTLCLILLGSVAGFLFWNWPRAKIFMGDVGSTQIGFILIVLGIYLNNENQFNIIQWIILTSPFWFDATYTMLRRLRNKEKLTQAHKKHAYQRMIQHGYTHLQTDLALIALNFLMAIIILIIRKFSFLTIPMFIAVILILYIITRMVDKRIPFSKDFNN